MLIKLLQRLRCWRRGCHEWSIPDRTILDDISSGEGYSPEYWGQCRECGKTMVKRACDWKSTIGAIANTIRPD